MNSKITSVGVDTLSCSFRDFNMLNDKADRVIELNKASDLPISQLKVRKNEVEMAGLREALIMESAALTSFYA